MKKLFLVLVLVLVSKAAFAVSQPLPSFTLQVNRIEPVLNQNLSSIQVYNLATNAQILNCTQNTCSISVKSGTKVRVVALGQNPVMGFSNWKRSNTGSGGLCVGSTNTNCDVTITADSIATALFKRIKIVRAQLGTGDGVVRVKLNGTVLVDCANRAPLDCSAGALEGTQVRFEAIAGPGQQFQKFTGQTGDATVCTGQGATFFCVFTLSNNPNTDAHGSGVVGNFIQIP